MGILSSLKKMVTGTDNDQKTTDSYGKEIEKCLVEIKLTENEFDLFAIYYYKGSTSYRDFFKNVFMYNMRKINEITKKASEKADGGCNIDFTFVRFIHNNKRYIDIPFDVFSEKRNMRISQRNNKLWNKANIKRILVDNPGLRTLDDDLIKESIRKVILENLSK